ncbi:uncharacterized protein V1518DRAFT_385054 [Limtongia smithiae]|uniref:uncharacterized protein n=1 Tax=Limtongia smithiae TaxID=1125753 RepID=UPI0034CEA30B
MHPPLLTRACSAALVKSCLLLSAYLPSAIRQLPFLAFAPNAGRHSLYSRDDDDDDFEIDGPKFWIFMGISVTLVLLGGVFAGLTLGLMGQDEVYLQVIEQTGSELERKNAHRVLALLKKGKHWVLVTMLLSNVITNETLPIVLDRCLGGGWPAVVSSTVLIVIFGEVIPQSVSVRYGLRIGAMFSPFVNFLMHAMYPVAYPIAVLLDHVLGEDHGIVYRKAQLKTLVTLHRSMGVDRLNKDEVTIISAVLDLNEKPVGNIMTPINDVYTMSADRILDEIAVEEILKAGYSRIPIHTPGEPYNFIGMLLVRILISYDPEDAQPVSTFPLATLPETKPDTNCLNVLNYFQEGKSHMMLVSDYPGEAYGALGVVTLEDVIEELIGEEIVDESDVYVDISQGIRRKYVSPLTRRTLPSEFVAQHQHSDGTSSGQTTSSHRMIPAHDWLVSNDPPNPIATNSAASSVPAIVTTAATPSTANGGVPATVMPKFEPLNLATRPNETTNAKVTIKKGVMEDYVRRHSMDVRPTYSMLGGVVNYGPPQHGADFGTIHDTERAALLKGPPASTAIATDVPSSDTLRAPQASSGLSLLMASPYGSANGRRSRRPSSIELDALERNRLVSDIRATGLSFSRHTTHSPIDERARTPGSETFSATSTTKLLDDMDGNNDQFHADGIIESVREVHGYRKTIIESAPRTDADDSDVVAVIDLHSDSGAEDTEVSAGNGSSNSRPPYHDSNPYSEIVGATGDNGSDHSSSDAGAASAIATGRLRIADLETGTSPVDGGGMSGQPARKGSFFSDRSFRLT